MKKMGAQRFGVVAALAWLSALVSIAIAGCSGSSSSSSSSGGGGGGGGGGTTASNVQAIQVNTGPAPATFLAVNEAFISVSVCVPGSSSQCQTVNNVLVDTGSEGLRVLASAMTLTLPQQKDSSGNSIVECTPFVLNELWGPVQMADVSIGSEKASNIAIQLIGSSSFPTTQAPTSCSNQGPVVGDLASVGANGILGVGNFVSDCGPGCATTSTGSFYYSCPTAGCSSSAQPVTLAEAQQVSNPVAAFATDNNGVIVELPSATAPEAGLNGSLIFGIGTQSNNGLGSATVFALDPNTGNFITNFKGTDYPNAFVDSGSNAIYFLDTTTTQLPVCTATHFTSWYCPSGPMSLMATNKDVNGGSATTINFTIDNAQTQLQNTNDGVAPALGGPNAGPPLAFDWGLTFFYGRNVFVAIAGKSTPGGTGPYVAY